MAKIKYDTANNRVILCYTETSNSIYDIKKHFILDLSNRKHYSLKNEEEEEIEWVMPIEEEKMMIENLIKEVSANIENNREVILSFQKQNNTKQVDKMKIHFEKNVKILDFLKNLSYN